MITPKEFAQKHFGEFNQKGVEIIPTYCPFCHGGKNGDKYTFALSLENETYNCKRGSCGEQGHFNQLLREFNEKAPSYQVRTPKKKFKQPKTEVTGVTSKVEEYLRLRKISPEVCKLRKVGEANGNIAFPYYENGKLVLMKFRKPEKYSGKGQKAWREEGGKAVFWGMDDCVTGKPLIITEGEFDALSLTESGLVNVVSVPSGSEDLTCVDHCWDWLDQFRKIIIWPDNDEPGQVMCDKLISKLGSWRCAVVESEYKDANECLYKAGTEGVLTEIEKAKDIPIAGLKSLADIKAFDYDGLTRIRSSIGWINNFTAGYRGGEVSIWTGDSGSGKSTFVGQELLEAIEQGYSVCAYSGELPGPVFRSWIDLQAAGPSNLSYKFDTVRGEEIPYVKSSVVESIRKWYADSFFICDEYEEVSDSTILELFQYAAMRHDCKVFLIDNLMSMTLEGPDSDYYRQQSKFLQQAKQFARRYDTHVHIVAHPRKSQGRITKSDVSGSKNITNWADNVFGVHRPPESENSDFDTTVDVLKCRFTGVMNGIAGLKFEKHSKRFGTKSESRKYYAYGWDQHREPPEVMAGGKN